jgi:hypothetical protein
MGYGVLDVGDIAEGVETGGGELAHRLWVNKGTIEKGEEFLLCGIDASELFG